MIIDWGSFGVAFVIGLLGGAHCLGMCGGIIGSLTMAVAADQYRQRLAIIISYNVGRILSYLLIAWLFYQLIAQLQWYFSLQFMRYVAGFLLIAMGLYLANWWRGLVYLEKAGGYLWRYIQPLSRSLLPVKNIRQALALGFIWGWLPCGLIYSALAYATTADSGSGAVLIMLGFALGTLPAVLSTGLVAERLSALIQKKTLRQFFAVLIILFGAWTLYHTISHSGHHHHGHEGHSPNDHNAHQQHHGQSISDNPEVDSEGGNHQGHAMHKDDSGHRHH